MGSNKRAYPDLAQAAYYPENKQTSIANGGNETAEIDLDGVQLVGIIMPAAWTAANLTFQGSDVSGGTYNNIYDDAGTEFTVTAAASRFIVLPPTALIGVRFLKIRSGTSGVPVNQGADRTLKLVCRSI